MPHPSPIHCRIVRASREPSRTLDDLIAALDSIELRPGDRIHLRVDRAGYVADRERRGQLYAPSGGDPSADHERMVARDRRTPRERAGDELTGRNPQ